MKAAIVNPAGGMVYQRLYAIVPRAVVPFYWHLPWAEVLAAAEAGKDGLSVWRNEDHNNLRPRLWLGPQDLSPADPPDVAYLAEGQQDHKGQTVLYQQNYTELEGAQ